LKVKRTRIDYTASRTHLALEKDAPLPRAVALRNVVAPRHPQIRRTGDLAGRNTSAV